MAVTKHYSVAESPYEGEDVTINVSPAEGQTPTDISGWTMEFVLAASADDDDLPEFTAKTVGAGITIVSAAAGTFTITLSAADLNLAPGKYTFSLRRTNSGFVTQMAEGTIRIKETAGA